MSFSFGSNLTTQGAGFGSAAKPSFSFGSTNTATTSTAGFGGFGTNTSSSGFGTFGTTTSTAAPFGGLGTTPASTAPSLFGGTGFGATAAKPATGFGTGGFGTNTFGTGTSTFGTGTSTFGTGTSTFGSAAPTFGTNTLGGNTFGGTGGSLFGGGSTFGSTFGNKPATTGFGGFGTGLGTTNAFGQPQQQQQQPQQQGPTNAHEALVAAVFNCSVFGDERDQVLAKWNLLQAQWGTGQAYYSRNAAPLELNEQNPLCRFKAVGYSRLSGKEDKHGLVALQFNKPEQEIKTNQQALTTSLSSLLGNKPNLAVNIESMKAISEGKTQVVIYVVDKNVNNSRISASELSAFLGAGNARAALTGAGCGAVAPITAPSQQMLAQYLQTPPPGMDMRLWKQAQADNPDPQNYIPVPIIGFTEIKFRARCQSEEAALQASWLRQAGDTLSELRTRRAASTARLAQLAASLHSLRHTLLQVIARQEQAGRVGAALSAEEEATRARLHELASQLAAPPLYNVIARQEQAKEESTCARLHELAASPLYNGRLNELLCAVRLQRSASAGTAHERYHLDPGAQEDVKQFVTLQQKGMAHLMETAKKDLDALNIIADGMARLVRA